MPSTSTLEGTLDASNNAGGSVEFQLHPQGDRTLFKYVNGLDVGVTIDIEATYPEDKISFANSETLLSGKAVAATDTDSDYLTEPWGVVKVTVTPNADPTSGTFELRTMWGN